MTDVCRFSAASFWHMMPCCTVSAFSLGFNISAYAEGCSLWLTDDLNLFLPRSNVLGLHQFG